MERKHISVLYIAIILLSVVSLKAQEASLKQLTLDNGLTVILNEDHSKKEIFGMVIVKAGAKNDPKDATGMAHYQEHMLFKGTTELGTSDWEKEKPHIDRIFELYDELGKTRDDSLRLKIQKEINEESIEAGKYSILNETSSLINQMGGTNMNAGTGWDQTVFYNSFPPNQFERWAELYSHRFMNPVFRAFQSELETVYEEKNMYQDNFITSLIETFNKNFYKEHPYGQKTIIGTSEDLKNPSLTKMYEFFKTYYVANNMALVIVGDFDSETVMPIIEDKFGKWESGEIPEQEKYTESAFNCREFVSGKYSPIKLGLLGFKTVPEGHQDELALQLFNTLIYNEMGTGVLNKLSQNGKIMESMIIPMHLQDYGSDLIFVIPKLIGQKTEEAERLVLDELYKVRDGGFTEEALDQAKKELYLSYQLEMEDAENRAYAFAQLFLLNKPLSDFENYPERITTITKEEIMRVAKAYYGDNYLAFHSEMGSPKKDKIEKPNYDPIQTNTAEISVFAKKFQEIPEIDVEPNFVDFEKDMQSVAISEDVNLFHVANPKNDIYTTHLVYKVGKSKIKEAELVAELMNRAGTKDFGLDELQIEFAKIGCSYWFGSDKESVQLELTGIEAQLERAYELIGELIAHPIIHKEDIKITRDNILSGRKIEREDPAEVAKVLLSYVLYENQASSINRLSKKELKAFEIEDFNRIWSEITSYKNDIHYTGSTTSQNVEAMIKKHIRFEDHLKAADQSAKISVKEYKKDIIYFVHRKDAIQSNIYFLVNGHTFSKEEVPVIDAFNAYFGGGFSGLVLQEIREYRSLAYSAGARYSTPDYASLNNYFIGMIGTQADKTLDAMTVFYDLKNNMPDKEERMSYITPYLVQTCITARPDFRDMSLNIDAWKNMGYDSDPSILTYEKAKDITFNDIKNFYAKNIQKQPMVSIIVGDKSKIDMEQLEEFGELIYIKEKSLYTK